MADRLVFPLTVSAGRLSTVLQDSDDDVAQCLLAIARTRPGDRWDQPKLGADPMGFGERPLDTSQLLATLTRHEPRRPLNIIETTPVLAAAVDQAVAELQITYDQQQGGDTGG